MNPELLKDYERRMKMMDALMDQNDLDAILFISTSNLTRQLCVKFLTGYTLITRTSYVFKRKGELPFLIVATVGQQFHARQATWLPEENVLSGGIELAAGMIGAIGKTRPRIGCYEPGETTVAQDRVLQSVSAEYVDLTEQFTEARANKSAYEIDCIRETSRIAAESFVYIVRNIAPGKTERELIGGAEGFLRAHGAQETLILTRSQKPHTFITRPSGVRIEEKGMFIYSAEVGGENGYWTQLVRPIFMRRDAEPEAYEILQVIKKAEAAGAAAFVPGNTISDVAAAVEKVVAESGCKTGIWAGHGMGIDLGDGVDIGVPNHMKIVPNMVLTLHPSVIGATDGLLYGNTWMSTEKDGAVCLTPQYKDVHYLDELKALIG